MLYSACWRVAREMGYEKIITYILSTETGVSLRATGWVCEGEAGGGTWCVKSRPRVQQAPTIKKLRFAKQKED